MNATVKRIFDGPRIWKPISLGAAAYVALAFFYPPNVY